MKLLERMPTENTRNYVLRILLHNISNLTLEPGQKISENEIAEILNISRTPIREALIELSKIDLVEIYPQRGSYVSKINYNIIEESRFLRLVIEKEILTLMCQGVDQKYIDALKSNLELEKKYAETNDIDKQLYLDNKFHKIMYESVGKMWTYGIISTQMVHFDRLRALSLSSIHSIKSERTIQDHENILYAILQKDAELCEMTLTKHLTRHQHEKQELLEKYPHFFK